LHAKNARVKASLPRGGNATRAGAYVYPLLRPERIRTIITGRAKMSYVLDLGISGGLRNLKTQEPSKVKESSVKQAIDTVLDCIRHESAKGP
jgi:hypothetical protein